MGFPSNNAKSKPSIQKSTPPCRQLNTSFQYGLHHVLCIHVFSCIYLTNQDKLYTTVLLHWARSFNSQMYIPYRFVCKISEPNIETKSCSLPLILWRLLGALQNKISSICIYVALYIHLYLLHKRSHKFSSETVRLLHNHANSYQQLTVYTFFFFGVKQFCSSNILLNYSCHPTPSPSCTTAQDHLKPCIACYIYTLHNQCT
jgi:hypothetical protein